MGIAGWLVIAFYAGLMIGVGVWYSRKNQTADDYLLGGRRMSPIAVGLSLFATLVSTLSYLGGPGEMIAHGPMMMTQSAAHPLVFLIVGFGLIPLLMRQPVTSQSVLVPLLGLDVSWTPWLCIFLGILTAIYSSTGGMRAVVMTDAIQSITMLAGAIVTLAVITVRMGGVSAWWPKSWPQHWQTPNWGFDPDARVSFGMLFVSTTLWYVCTNGSDQMSIQRFLATRDAKAARRTLAVSQITDVLVSVLLSITGLAILGFYQAHPPQLEANVTIVDIGDQLFPKFIMSEMPDLLAGLVLAAILSAALSSLSSGVNSACAVVEKDFLSRHKAGTTPETTSLRRLVLLTWIIAAVSVGLSLVNTLIQGNIIERCYKVVNLLTAPLFVLFFLALFVRWSNGFGAWCGLISSTLAAIAIAYAKDLGLPLGISFVWMTPCSLLTGILIGAIASAAWPQKRATA